MLVASDAPSIAPIAPGCVANNPATTSMAASGVLQSLGRYPCFTSFTRLRLFERSGGFFVRQAPAPCAGFFILLALNFFSSTSYDVIRRSARKSGLSFEEGSQ